MVCYSTVAFAQCESNQNFVLPVHKKMVQYCILPNRHGIILDFRNILAKSPYSANIPTTFVNGEFWGIVLKHTLKVALRHSVHNSCYWQTYSVQMWDPVTLTCIRFWTRSKELTRGLLHREKICNSTSPWCQHTTLVQRQWAPSFSINLVRNCMIIPTLSCQPECDKIEMGLSVIWAE